MKETSADENEQAFGSGCGISAFSLHGNPEEIADGIDRMNKEGGKDCSEQLSSGDREDAIPP
jgi:hypothetical protein